MAAIADALYRTSVFAQNQQVTTASVTNQPLDIFARRDRRATSISVPPPCCLTVRLSVDGGPIEFTYTTFGDGLPRWIDAVLQSLSERWGVRPGWDGYEAKPTNPRLVVKLLNILSDLLQDDSQPPQMTPLGDGGVQAEWHHHEQDLEIVLPADEDASYYYFDNTTSVEEEAKIRNNYDRIQDLIKRLG